MKTYNIALLGAGKISATMARTLHGMQHADAYAVASRDIVKAKAFAKEHSIPKAYGSYTKMLQDPAIDLVYVATPHSHHAEHALLCLEYGKPVLVEKAFTGNAAQAEAVLGVAREKNLLVAEAIWTRYSPLAKKMRELIDTGAIGEVNFLSANLGYDIDAIPRMASPELAGGALLDLGVYPLTFASIAFGSAVKAVTGTAMLTPNGVDAQNTITLQYANNRMASLYATMLVETNRRGIVYGTKGRIETTASQFDYLALYDAEGNQTGYWQRPENHTGYEYQVEACIRALEAGQIECPEMPHSEILRIMQLMDSLRQSFGVRYPFD